MIDSRRLAALAILPFVLSCGDGAGPNSATLKDPAGLSTQLARFNQALDTPQLRSLAGLALHVYLDANVDVHYMSPATWGKTLEWDPTTQKVAFTSRTGAPADAVRLILYATDVTTGLPATPLTEVGYVDMFPYNDYNGPGTDSTSLRYIVTAGTTSLVADFLAHSHFQACLCAVVEGWASDGTTRVDFTVPYTIIYGHDAEFPGSYAVTNPGFEIEPDIFIPAAGDSLAGLRLRLAHAGDSVTTTGNFTLHRSGPITGDYAIAVNARPFATVHVTPGGVSVEGVGRSLSAVEQAAAEALLATPANIALNIEWPTLVIFFCGC